MQRHLVESDAGAAVLHARRQVVLVDEERQAEQGLTEGERLADGAAAAVREDRLDRRAREDAQVRNAAVHLDEHVLRQREGQQLAVRIVHEPKNLIARLVRRRVEALRQELDHLGVELGHVAEVNVDDARLRVPRPHPALDERRQLEEHLATRGAPQELTALRLGVAPGGAAAGDGVDGPARQDRARRQHQRRLLLGVVELGHDVLEHAHAPDGV
mmetsp:Transcript_866/g.2326  ORF Transcript_866/g.2326 Transcript_866/m.2326 type:complete len:215 (+) Transcript_866:1014-1658(+)